MGFKGQLVWWSKDLHGLGVFGGDAQAQTFVARIEGGKDAGEALHIDLAP